MPDGQGGDDGSWDWDRPFDDDFVRGAAAREDTGQARADRAARIASQHRSSRSWRSDRPALDTRNREPRPVCGAGGGSRRLFYGVLAVLGVGLLLLATGVVGGSGSSSADGGLLGASAPPADEPTAAPTPVVDPPVPADARATRLRPLPAVVPGSGGYRFDVIGGTAGEVRWDPCRPIHYVTRAGGAPSGGSALVQSAFDTLSAATGLQFVDDGITDESPSRTRPSVETSGSARRFAPVLVAWSDEREYPLLKDEIAGYTSSAGGDDGRGARLVSGQVVLDAPDFARFTPTVRTQVVRHELGHLVGLDHVTDPSDVMYADGLDSSVRTYTPGAARGLRLLGSGTCFS